MKIKLHDLVVLSSFEHDTVYEVTAINKPIAKLVGVKFVSGGYIALEFLMKPTKHQLIYNGINE